MTTAALYARISDDTHRTGLGVERQLQDCRRLAASRGWTIADEFVDNDISAYNGKPRPGYKRLLEAVEGEQIKAIVAWHPDRLHRSPRELEDFIDLLERHKVDVATVTAGVYDLTTPTGRMQARVAGAVAKHESEHKSQRQTRKHQELALAGKVSGGGTRPYGYEYRTKKAFPKMDDAERTVVVPNEAANVREAVRRILAGDSLRGIARDWQDRGVVSPTGKPWKSGPLRRMLTSPHIAGQREYQGEVVAKGGWPRIIGPTDLARVRGILLDPARRRNYVARRYLLTGFLYCGLCGQAMIARPRGDKVRRYVCARVPGFNNCGKLAILAEPLEEQLSEMVLTAIDSPELEAAIRAKAAKHVETVSLDDLHRDEAALQELAKDHYVDRIIGKAEFLVARQALEARIEATRKQLHRSNGTAALADVVGTAREKWPSLSFDRRRAIIGAVVDRVTIGSGRRGYNRYDPSRVNIEWRA